MLGHSREGTLEWGQAVHFPELPSFDRRQRRAISLWAAVRTHRARTVPNRHPEQVQNTNWFSPPCSHQIKPESMTQARSPSKLSTASRGYSQGRTDLATLVPIRAGSLQFHEHDCSQQRAPAWEAQGGVPETCATSHTPPGRTSPTACPTCPCHPHRCHSSWARTPLSCETSSGKPVGGGEGNTHY